MQQFPRRWRQVLATLAIISTGLPAAGCGGSAADPHRSSAALSPAVRGSPSATAPSTIAPPAIAPSTATRSSPSAAGSALALPCSTTALQANIGAANGAAGSSYYPIVFTNVSGGTCTLFGYPGVSLVSGIGGSQIGGAASRNPTFAPQTVTLAPGGTVHATLQAADALIYSASSCQPVTAHWLRVYPPGQFTPLYVSFTTKTCTGQVPATTLGIYVVRPGATGP